MDGTDHAPPRPATDLRTRVDGAAVNHLSPEKKSRLFEGLSDNLFIYPIERSTYRVVSIKENAANTTYTISVFDRPICECYDYIFECVGSKQWCKHIFRVWAEVHVGELPPLGIEPDKWLQSKLEDVLFTLIDNPSDEEAEQARALRAAYDALDDDPTEDDLWHATSLWRECRTTAPTP